MPRNSLAKRILTSRLFLVLLAGILLLFAIGFLKAFWQDRQIQKEIKRLEDVKAQLETMSSKLDHQLKEAESAAFVEKEARLRLGLVIPGEREVRLLEIAEKVTSSASSAAGKVKVPNYRLWWQYFFNSVKK